MGISAAKWVALVAGIVLCCLAPNISSQQGSATTLPPPSSGSAQQPPSGEQMYGSTGMTGTTGMTATGCCGDSLNSFLEISVESMGRCVRTNAVPNHEYHKDIESANPNTVCEQFKRVCLPLNPVKGTTMQSSAMGPVGIMVSGGYMYNHLSSPTGDAAVYNEAPSLDGCNGHADPGNNYHYHSVPKCIPGAMDASKSVFLGWLFDGFQVRGYSMCGNQQCKSCYVLQTGSSGAHSSHYTYNQQDFVSGDCHLDQANGIVLNGTYSYVVTANYPFVMPGYYGTYSASLSDDYTISQLGINNCTQGENIATGGSYSTIEPPMSGSGSMSGPPQIELTPPNVNLTMGSGPYNSTMPTVFSLPVIAGTSACPDSSMAMVLSPQVSCMLPSASCILYASHFSYKLSHFHF